VAHLKVHVVVWVAQSWSRDLLDIELRSRSMAHPAPARVQPGIKY
jgi:hypothetical protein